MPKYLFKSHLNVQGLEGTLKDGGTGRRAAVKSAGEALGGKLEAFYYAFGSTDAYVIMELPDNAAALAAAASVVLSGAGGVETVVLIEPEEIDATAETMSRMADAYRPPGG